jgi:putative ABC transport system permease protein
MNTLEFSIVGVFRSMSKEYDARGVQIPLQMAAELVDTRGISALIVLLEDTAQTERALAALTARLPGDRYEVKTWHDLADFYTSTAAFYERQFAVLHLIILVMVLLSVANTVNMTLHERTGEFGVMRALGRRGADIFRLAVLESAVLGLIGATLGLIIGVALALLISAAGIPMPPGPNSESGLTAAIRLVPAVLASASVLGIVGTMVASLLPARRAARIPVVDALRQAI